MNYSAILVSLGIALVLPLLAYLLGRRSGPQGSDEEAAQLREESRVIENKLVETLSEADRFASKSQVEFLRQQCQAFRQAIAEQEQSLAGLAERVDQAQTSVHSGESDQQELRAMKEEDEVAINQTLNRYNEFSTESLSLEQKLAESLRSLDVMTSEIQMTTDQQAVFAELSNALTQASAQLRDVIIDYQNANDRLRNLSSRFTDLENEYSKLVDQQLAG
jgi:chromosome segregation ATPase